MLIETIYGLIFVVALFSALMVVLSPHAVYSALFLVLTMVATAGLFVMMNAQLAAAFQVIVYAGAIVVLFLFVIMLLNLGHEGDPSARGRWTRRLGLILSLALMAQFFMLFTRFADLRGLTLEGARGIQIGQVARLLLTEYLYAFEMTSVLLLAAVVGAVVLARRQPLVGPAATAAVSPATPEGETPPQHVGEEDKVSGVPALAGLLRKTSPRRVIEESKG